MPGSNVGARVGIIADDRLQQHLLKSALSHFGFRVVLSTDPQRYVDLGPGENFVEPDAWVVDLTDEEQNHNEWLEPLFDGETPVLFGMGEAPEKSSENYPRWEKRLFAKMKELLAGVDLATADEDSITQLDTLVADNSEPFPLPAMFRDFEMGLPAQHVWVLGASLGGPAAVKEFLDALPAGLPIGLIYAQHIDSRFQDALIQTIGRHSSIRLVGYEPGLTINTGEMMMAPVEHEFDFDADGRTISKTNAWPGPYGPSVDQVMLNVGRHFGNRARYILFSGMGNDGAEATTQLAHQKSVIWAQTSDSCANSSMPDSAVATGHVTYIGSPRQLALQLVNYLQTQWMN